MSTHKKLGVLFEMEEVFSDSSKDAELEPLLISVNGLSAFLKAFENNANLGLESLRAHLEEVVLQTFKLYPKRPQIVSECMAYLGGTSHFVYRYYYEETVLGQAARMLHEWYEVLATIEDAFINSERNK